ncbi:GTP-binding protein [Staphylococcus schleiferi subsp. coagulans]|uniref:CobW family GTP-binding protein n=1 Tax=Staphylococcus coagulans TaxID=74706 RepID=UPI0015F918B5|nr:GTP-binding protein [Staphylococcus coagulans]MBA8779718.1 GTP-binding protein [Staphylococcus coagulans]
MDIVILSGFLGGGKTSTLNYLVQDALDNHLKPAVIMNDFGARSVDEHLVTEDVQMEVLVNGCICCELKEDVSQQLHELYLSYQPDIVLVECSGVAHPIGVFDACMTPVLAPYIEDITMLGLVDVAAYYEKKELPESVHHLIFEQFRYCSHLILNKIDLLNNEALLSVVDEIQQTYPNIPYILTSYGELTLNEVQHQSQCQVNERSSVHHHGQLSHLMYEFDAPVQQTALIEGLQGLEDIYRIKGFVYLKDCKNPCVVQYTPGNLEIKPCPIPMKPYLIVVGHNLDYQEITDTFDVMELAS